MSVIAGYMDEIPRESFWNRARSRVKSVLSTAREFVGIYSAKFTSNSYYRTLEGTCFGRFDNELYGGIMDKYTKLIRDTRTKVNNYNSLGKGILETMLKEMEQSKKLAY